MVVVVVLIDGVVGVVCLPAIAVPPVPYTTDIILRTTVALKDLHFLFWRGTVVVGALGIVLIVAVTAVRYCKFRC